MGLTRLYPDVILIYRVNKLTGILIISAIAVVGVSAFAKEDITKFIERDNISKIQSETSIDDNRGDRIVAATDNGSFDKRITQLEKKVYRLENAINEMGYKNDWSSAVSTNEKLIRVSNAVLYIDQVDCNRGYRIYGSFVVSNNGHLPETINSVRVEGDYASFERMTLLPNESKTITFYLNQNSMIVTVYDIGAPIILQVASSSGVSYVVTPTLQGVNNCLPNPTIRPIGIFTVSEPHIWYNEHTGVHGQFYVKNTGMEAITINDVKVRGWSAQFEHVTLEPNKSALVQFSFPEGSNYLSTADIGAAVSLTVIAGDVTAVQSVSVERA